MNTHELLTGILLYGVLPLWVAAGFADYLCHRRTRIEATSGIVEFEGAPGSGQRRHPGLPDHRVKRPPHHHRRHALARGHADGGDQKGDEQHGIAQNV